MILAILANRTLVKERFRHYCKLDAKIVDKIHLNECTLLKQEKITTFYNEILQDKSLYELDEQL